LDSNVQIAFAESDSCNSNDVTDVLIDETSDDSGEIAICKGRNITCHLVSAITSHHTE